MSEITPFVEAHPLPDATAIVLTRERTRGLRRLAAIVTLLALVALACLCLPGLVAAFRSAAPSSASEPASPAATLAARLDQLEARVAEEARTRPAPGPTPDGDLAAVRNRQDELTAAMDTLRREVARCATRVPAVSADLAASLASQEERLSTFASDIGRTAARLEVLARASDAAMKRLDGIDAARIADAHALTELERRCTAVESRLASAADARAIEAERRRIDELEAARQRDATALQDLERRCRAAEARLVSEDRARELREEDDARRREEARRAEEEKRAADAAAAADAEKGAKRKADADYDQKWKATPPNKRFNDATPVRWRQVWGGSQWCWQRQHYVGNAGAYWWVDDNGEVCREDG